MKWSFLLLCALASLLPSIEAATPREAREGLDRATAYFRSIDTNGGYLWRYSPDLRKRWGETEARETEIWVQPPGTPAVGMAFLRAYEVTGDRKHLDAARDAARALAYGQLDSGGWDYRIDFDPQGAARYLRRAEAGKLNAQQKSRRRNNTVFDDDNTQSAIRFLLAYAKAAKGSAPAEVNDALEYALAAVLKAQYPNGAWPQVYTGAPRNPADYPLLRATLVKEHRDLPKVKEYWHYYTFNDHAMRKTAVTLLEAHRQLGRMEYLDAAKKCGEFILTAQLPEPQPAWAQQYDFQMRPSWARKFEPPSVCSHESAGVIDTLIDLYLVTGEEKYLSPIPRAIAWLRRSQIGENRWARFYEMVSNRPLYFTKEYELVYTDTDLPTHYGFQGEYGIPATIARYEEVKRSGRAAYLKAHEPKPGNPQRLERATGEVLRTMDAKGRWITDGKIECATFVRNVEVLCDYLEATQMRK
jgi:PelA/Pel-15E family pectate lyase